MTTRSQVQSAIEQARDLLCNHDDPVLSVLVAAAESARYKSITGKPVTDPVYESPSDLLDNG